MSYEQLVDDVRTDPVLCTLTEAQLEAVIRLLALAMLADGERSELELTQLEQLLDELPWLEAKTDLVQAFVRRAELAARGVRGEDDFREIVELAGHQIEARELRMRVYAMASAMVWVDRELRPNESRAMGWLADGLELDRETAGRLLDEVRDRWG